MSGSEDEVKYQNFVCNTEDWIDCSAKPNIKEKEQQLKESFLLRLLWQLNTPSIDKKTLSSVEATGTAVLNIAGSNLPFTLYLWDTVL